MQILTFIHIQFYMYLLCTCNHKRSLFNTFQGQHPVIQCEGEGRFSTADQDNDCIQHDLQPGENTRGAVHLCPRPVSFIQT